MKRLILLLLLAACSHEHPLTDHQHDVPNHDHLNPIGLHFPYIQRVSPPLDVPGFPPYGTLKEPPFENVDIYFVGYPANLYLTLYDGLHKTGDVTMERVRRLDGYGAHVTVSTDCEDPEHTGWIGFRLDWEGGSANLQYSCAEEE